MDDFLNRSETITPEEFFEIKQQQKGDVVGVYIIHYEGEYLFLLHNFLEDISWFCWKSF